MFVNWNRTCSCNEVKSGPNWLITSSICIVKIHNSLRVGCCSLKFAIGVWFGTSISNIFAKVPVSRIPHPASVKEGDRRYSRLYNKYREISPFTIAGHLKEYFKLQASSFKLQARLTT